MNNHSCFLKYEKNCIRMTRAFLAIIIMIKLLTNRDNTKKQPIVAGDLDDENLGNLSVPNPLKLLRRYFPSA